MQRSNEPKLRGWLGLLVGACGVILIIVLCVCAPVGPSKAYNTLLLLLAAFLVGAAFGFLASCCEADDKNVARLAQHFTSAITGASLSLLAVKGAALTSWLAEELQLSAGVVVVMGVPFCIVGFLVMYFCRHLYLNPAIQGAKVAGEAERVYDVLLVQGMSLKAQGALGAAKKKFQRATALNKEDPRAWAGLAATLLDSGRNGEALQAMNMARTLAGTNPAPALLMLSAQIEQGAGETAEAKQSYSQYLQAHPADAGAHFSLAKVLAREAMSAVPKLKSELERQAVDEIKQAVELDSRLGGEVRSLMEVGGVFEALKGHEGVAKIVSG